MCISIYVYIYLRADTHLDPFTTKSLDAATKADVLANVQLIRDAIVFFTSCGAKSGYGGHTGAGV